MALDTKVNNFDLGGRGNGPKKIRGRGKVVGLGRVDCQNSTERRDLRGGKVGHDQIGGCGFGLQEDKGFCKKRLRQFCRLLDL